MQDNLFDQLPEQRKPSWQEESTEDFELVLKTLAGMSRRIKTPHLRDTGTITSIIHRIIELQHKDKKSVTK